MKQNPLTLQELKEKLKSMVKDGRRIATFTLRDAGISYEKIELKMPTSSIREEKGLFYFLYLQDGLYQFKANTFNQMIDLEKIEKVSESQLKRLLQKKKVLESELTVIEGMFDLPEIRLKTLYLDEKSKRCDNWSSNCDYCTCGSSYILFNAHYDGAIIP